MFLHGTWHGAWCWSERFLDYFAANGFAAYALSFRGHGESEGRDRLRFARVRDFVDDFASLADMLPTPPIVVGHSMGGYVAQKYLERRQLPGVVLVASAPPRGLWRSLVSHARRDPLALLKCSLALRLSPMIADPERARALFFSPSVPPQEARRYCALLQDDSYLAYLDCLALDPVDVAKITTPMMVAGGALDVVIPPNLVLATARAYRVEPVMFDTMAHDMMLERDWRRLADAILAWVETLDAVAPQRLPMAAPSSADEARQARRMNAAV